MFRSVIASLILTFALCFGISAQTREAPKGWKEIRMCGLSFSVPKSMKKQKIRPIDSCVGEFKSRLMWLGFDYGMYTAPPPVEPKRATKREEIVIDGKKAILTTSDYGASVYILIYQDEYGKQALGMNISGKTTKATEIAKQIIQSIRFVKSK